MTDLLLQAPLLGGVHSPFSNLHSSPPPQGRPRVTVARFPSADEVARGRLEIRPESAVDVLLVNPPAPDGGIWIRSQHRVGRRSREGMIWPQVSLAQMAALLVPDYSVEIIDAIAERMTWPQFEALLREKCPRYYVTQVTGPTLQNDMYGCFLARSLGACTIAFGTHVTPMTRETMEPYPSLDFVLRGEPELTLVELIETLESTNRRIGESVNRRMADTLQPGRGRWEKLFREADPDWQPAIRHPRIGLATERRNRDQSRPIVHQEPGRPASAPARPVATGPLPHPDGQGTLHLCRHQPGLSGWLQVLHQARQLPVFGAHPVA